MSPTTAPTAGALAVGAPAGPVRPAWTEAKGSAGFLPVLAALVAVAPPAPAADQSTPAPGGEPAPPEPGRGQPIPTDPLGLATTLRIVDGDGPLPPAPAGEPVPGAADVASPDGPTPGLGWRGKRSAGGPIGRAGFRRPALALTTLALASAPETHGERRADGTPADPPPGPDPVGPSEPPVVPRLGEFQSPLVTALPAFVPPAPDRSDPRPVPLPPEAAPLSGVDRSTFGPPGPVLRQPGPAAVALPRPLLAAAVQTPAALDPTRPEVGAAESEEAPRPGTPPGPALEPPQAERLSQPVLVPGPPGAMTEPEPASSSALPDPPAPAGRMEPSHADAADDPVRAPGASAGVVADTAAARSSVLPPPPASGREAAAGSALFVVDDRLRPPIFGEPAPSIGAPGRLLAGSSWSSAERSSFAPEPVERGISPFAGSLDALSLPVASTPAPPVVARTTPAGPVVVGAAEADPAPPEPTARQVGPATHVPSHAVDRPPAAVTLEQGGEQARDGDGEPGGDRAPVDGTRTVAAVPSRTVAGPAMRDEGMEPAAPPRPVVDQVVERVTFLRKEGRQVFLLWLDPPELGAVRIEAVLDGQRLALHIRAEQEPARELLAEALPRLRESLTQQGFVPGQVTVGLGLDSFAHQDPWGGHAAWEPPVIRESLGRAPRAVARPAAIPEPTGAGVDLWV